MQTFANLREFSRAVGTHLGYSPWRRISQNQIDLFGDATDDHQWIHVDPERAAEGPFGTTIVHGYLTLSLVPGLMWQVFSIGQIKMGLNYGSNKVRFPTPVKVDSNIRAGVFLKALDRTAIGYQATLDVTVEIEGSDKPACVVQAVSLLVPQD